MKWSITEHVLGHAAYIKDGLKEHHPQGGLHHFKASIDLSQFLLAGYTTEDAIDAVMTDIVEKVHTIHTFREKNGFRKNKNGTRTQKYANLKYDLSKTLIAYHKDAFDDETVVERHIHIVADVLKENGSKVKYGVGYSAIKQAMQTAADAYGLTFHFSEQKQNDDLKAYTKKQQEKATRFSWMLGVNSDAQFESYVRSDSFKENLSFFIEYTRNRHLLNWRVKTMETLRRRLERCNMDLRLDITNPDDEQSVEYNFRHAYPIDLSEAERELLNHLQNMDYQAIKPLTRKSQLARELIKHSFGFPSQTIRALRRSGFDIPRFDPQKHVASIKKKSQITSISKTKNVYIDRVTHALWEAACSVNNEIDFLKKFSKLMQIDQALFMYRGKHRFGVKFLTHQKKKPFEFQFAAHGIDYHEVEKQFRSPVKEASFGINTNTILTAEAPKPARPKPLRLTIRKNIHLLLQVVMSKRTETKAYTQKQLDAVVLLQKSYAKVYGDENSKSRTIVTNHSRIIDRGNILRLAASKRSMKESVSEILALAELKGWDVATLNIEGSYEFQKEMYEQVAVKLESEYMLSNPVTFRMIPDQPDEALKQMQSFSDTTIKELQPGMQFIHEKISEQEKVKSQMQLNINSRNQWNEPGMNPGWYWK